MPCVEGTDFKTRLAGRLLVLGTGPVERVLVRRADGEEASELELGVSGDELGLTFEDGGLGASVTGADGNPARDRCSSSAARRVVSRSIRRCDRVGATGS